MNTLEVEAALAKEYEYRPLPRTLSQKYRDYFKDNIPPRLLHAEGIPIKTRNGSVIANDFIRIVIGDYGAFIEFSEEQANRGVFIVAPGQEYRINDPKYSNVKYHWYTIPDGSNVKIYHQRKRVLYADYRPGMYYVSVHEVS